MAIIDKGRLKRKVQFVEYRSSLGVIGSGSVADASAHTGAAVEKELASTGLVGLFMDDAGDMVNVTFPVPRDLNPTQPIGVRVVYATGSSTAADTVDWIVLYDVITEGTALAVGSTALNTAIAQDTVTGTASALEISPRGVINGLSVTEAQVANSVSMFSMLVECDAFAAGLTEDIIYLGLLIDYMPKRGQGHPQTFKAGLTDE